MKSLKFNRKSWHYELAKHGGYDDSYKSDICEYTKAILKGIFSLFILLSAFALITFVVIDMAFGIVFSIISGMWLMGVAGMTGIVILVLGSFVFSLFAISEYIGNWNAGRRYKASGQPDSFVTHAYKSWKNRFCAKITFID